MYLDNLRYKDLSYEEFIKVKNEYYEYIIKMPFGSNNCILKYFGDSFFHDAKLLLLNLNPLKRSLNLDLSSVNFLEDINQYRSINGFSKVEEKLFWDNPIVLKFSFSRVMQFTSNLCLNHGLFVMDTEILSYDTDKGYEICIHLKDSAKIRFWSKTASISIDTNIIEQYTNGLKKIPYCTECKSKLLTKKKLIKLLEFCENKLRDKKMPWNV